MAPAKAAAKKPVKKASAKAAPKKAAPKKAAPQKANAKAPVKKTAVPAKKVAAKAPAKAAPKKAAAKAAPAKAPAKVAPKAAPAKKVAAKAPLKAAPEKAPPAKAVAKKAAPPAPVMPKKVPPKPGRHVVPSKDFDQKFLENQRQALLAERIRLTGQAVRLEEEANSLIEDVEMGDVQFDDESGEGDTMVVERERDLALSAQARQTVSEIDDALLRLADGTYGYSMQSGVPIPKERLKAIPWVTLRVDEKAGGIGRR